VEQFFKEKGLLRIVDRLAKRYGKTPHEILTCMTVSDFNFNIAVMMSAELEDSKPTQKPVSDWGKLGIQREVIKKG